MHYKNRYWPAQKKKKIEIPKSFQSIEVKAITASWAIGINFPESQTFVIFVFIEWIQMLWIIVDWALTWRSTTGFHAASTYFSVAIELWKLERKQTIIIFRYFVKIRNQRIQYHILCKPIKENYYLFIVIAFQ